MMRDDVAAAAVAQLRDALTRLQRRRNDWHGVWLSIALLFVVLTRVLRHLFVVRSHSSGGKRSIVNGGGATTRKVTASATSGNGNKDSSSSSADDKAGEASARPRVGKTVKLADAPVIVCENKDNEDDNDNDSGDSDDDSDAEAATRGAAAADDKDASAVTAAGAAKTAATVHIHTAPLEEGSGKRGVRRSQRPHSKQHRHHHHSSSSSRGKELDSTLPTVMLVVGIHGSGKTEWATQYVHRVHRSYELISSDTLRRTITGAAHDYSREDEVAAALLREVCRVVAAHHSCVIDDCQHNLSSTFRAQVLQLVPRDKYNVAMKLLPIKTLFARTRIEKDVHDGRPRYTPTALQLDEQQEQYERTEASAKEEGWVLIM